MKIKGGFNVAIVGYICYLKFIHKTGNISVNLMLVLKPFNVLYAFIYLFA